MEYQCFDHTVEYQCFDHIVSIRPPGGPDLLTHFCAQATAIGFEDFYFGPF